MPVGGRRQGGPLRCVGVASTGCDLASPGVSPSPARRLTAGRGVSSARRPAWSSAGRLKVREAIACREQASTRGSCDRDKTGTCAQVVCPWSLLRSSAAAACDAQSGGRGSTASTAAEEEKGRHRGGHARAWESGERWEARAHARSSSSERSSGQRVGGSGRGGESGGGGGRRHVARRGARRRRRRAEGEEGGGAAAHVAWQRTATVLTPLTAHTCHSPCLGVDSDQHAWAMRGVHDDDPTGTGNLPPGVAA